MTEVAFHFNVPDRMDYTCRLLRKAVASNAKLVVTGLAETLQQLDAALWTFSVTDFVPHCHHDADARVLAASRVILTPSIETVPDGAVLLNLGPVVPDRFERFERVIEIVGQDDDDRRLARGRWKHYTQRGHAITRHDLTLKTSTP